MIQKDFIRYYISGYLNTYYTGLQFGFNPEKETYQQYKLNQLCDYIGIKRLSINISFLMSFVTFIETFASLLFILYRFIRVLFKWQFVNQRCYEGVTFFASLSIDKSRAKSLLKALDISDLSSLTIPFVKNKYQENEVDILSGLYFSDIYLSLCGAVKVVLYMYIKYRKRDFLFRFYSSFEYLLACFFVKNTEGKNKFVYYSLYDRWGFLFSNTIDSVLIQHGILTDYIRYIKIGTPSFVYYLSEKQKTILDHFLFGDKPKAYGYRPHLEFVGNEILKENGKKHVLLVCYSNQIRYEKEIAKLISKMVNLYIKPHPFDKDITEYEKICKKYDCILLPKTSYPHVDLVLSYQSTLADEYEEVGVKVVRYDLLNRMDEIIKEVNAMHL